MMTPENFCYWLKGFIEVADPNIVTGAQLREIKNHLDLVFHKVTPTVTLLPQDCEDRGSPGIIQPQRYC